jgi:hypothetical protein
VWQRSVWFRPFLSLFLGKTDNRFNVMPSSSHATEAAAVVAAAASA